ncbi:hypothetical protein [uncultured Croceitalea sp.]|uniref:hypothetical protein n=1 Tax=uncultured Croceitalea sp. TaxID=1798908 RepID=UPI003305A64C
MPQADISSSEGNESASSISHQNPTELKLEVEVLESFTSKKQVCDLMKSNVALVRINQVIEYGSGVINVPKKGAEEFVPFLFLKTTYTSGTTLLVTCKESLCKDASSTYMTAMKHQVLE